MNLHIRILHAMHEAKTTEPKNTPDHMTIDPNSAEWWSRWSDWLKIAGFILGGIVTVVAVVGWAFSLKAGKLKDEASKRKEAALERFKLESDRSISLADAKAAEANKIAATANVEAARANERAAILEKDAADSRLALVKLQQKLAWRVITPEQSQRFREAVRNAPKSKITMTYLGGNEEVVYFTDQFAKMLRDGGYEAPDSLSEMNSQITVGGLMIGVILCIKDEKSLPALHLQQALALVGIDAPGRLNPNQQDDIHIDIGAKPSNE